MAEVQISDKDETQKPKNIREPDPNKIVVNPDHAKITKKPSSVQRLVKSLVTGDASTIGGYILNEILIPSLKSTIMDILTKGGERVLYNGQKSTRYVPYTSYSSSRKSTQSSVPIRVTQSSEPSYSQQRWQRSHTYVSKKPLVGDIFLPSSEEAEDLLDNMTYYIERDGYVTVADYCDMIGTTSLYTDEHWGWTDLRRARIRDVMMNGDPGVTIDFPPIEAID